MAEPVEIPLVERVERASGPDRELDLAIARLVRGVPVNAAFDYALDDGVTAWAAGLGFRVLAYTASMDDAATLIPEGWELSLSTFANPPRATAYLINSAGIMTKREQFYLASAPLAIVSAALKARTLTQGEEK